MQEFPLASLEKQEPRPRLHFIGIGGVHMSAIAELLFRRGFPVLCRFGPAGGKLR